MAIKVPIIREEKKICILAKYRREEKKIVCKMWQYTIAKIGEREREREREGENCCQVVLFDRNSSLFVKKICQRSLAL